MQYLYFSFSIIIFSDILIKSGHSGPHHEKSSLPNRYQNWWKNGKLFPTPKSSSHRQGHKWITFSPTISYILDILFITQKSTRYRIWKHTIKPIQLSTKEPHDSPSNWIEFRNNRSCANHSVGDHRFSPIYHQKSNIRTSNHPPTMKYATLGRWQRRNRACILWPFVHTLNTESHAGLFRGCTIP